MRAIFQTDGEFVRRLDDDTGEEEKAPTPSLAPSEGMSLCCYDYARVTDAVFGLQSCQRRSWRRCPCSMSARARTPPLSRNPKPKPPPPKRKRNPPPKRPSPRRRRHGPRANLPSPSPSSPLGNLRPTPPARHQLQLRHRHQHRHLKVQPRPRLHRPRHNRAVRQQQKRKKTRPQVWARLSIIEITRVVFFLFSLLYTNQKFSWHVFFSSEHTC